MKLALYRKYRPTRFSDVVGQEDVVSALKNQIVSGQLGHAYIFTGIRGTGKTTLAKILAKAVNCPNSVDGEPCGVCDICKGIDNGSVLDVTEMDAASNNGVNDVRELLDETHYSPVNCRMRVYIVDEAHMMSTPAFNALLKTIEEPPAHVMFIFATTEVNKLPVTIKSRCQRFDLKRIPESKIVSRLMYVADEEGITLAEDAAKLLARLADGALRDALTLFDTCASYGSTVDLETVKKISGLTDKTYLFNISSLIAKGDCNALIDQIHSLYADGADAKKLLTELIRHYRDLMMVGTGGVTLSDCSEEVQRQYEAESKRYAVKELLHILEKLAQASDRMGKSLDNDIAFELAVLSLCGEKLTGQEVYYAPAPAPEKEQTRTEKKVPVPETAVSAAPAKEQPAPKADDLPPWVSEIDSAKPVSSSPAKKTAKIPEEKTPVISDAPVYEDIPAPAPAPVGQEPDDAFADISRSQWQQVISIIKKQNLVLATMLKDSVPHLEDNRLLIEANDIAYKFIRENADSRQIIKDSFQHVTGLRRNIGPWKKPETVAADSDDGLDAFLEKAAQMGISVETKQEIEK